MTRSVAVVGAGAWGTALAIHAARTGAAVSLWARDPAAVLDPGRRPRRLPGTILPEAVDLSGTLPRRADAILLAVPTQHLRAVAAAMDPESPLVSCCKGLERDTLLLPSEILAALHPGLPRAALSGPNFAGEVAAGLPAAAVLAASRLDDARALAALLSTDGFRCYAGDDPAGVEAGGAIKNVLAIAAGAAIGAGYGENARAALVTRGLAELSRFAAALGGRRDTAAGLSGLGDLLLTCTGPASRNFTLGVELGRGRPLADILATGTGVAEGVFTAASLRVRARRLGVPTPICDTVDDLLRGAITLDAARAALLSRPLGEE
ncbi:MAG: NAD(P)H-dependent glycerol-3-phosphate dehydrogenase [Gluconacetobacter diazotrophicus]|nr:NAD(P)H-dependent glycerol-3-phosphate dehydrogenase [Gluconacetobacter diazotrophicus]